MHGFVNGKTYVSFNANWILLAKNQMLDQMYQSIRKPLITPWSVHTARLIQNSIAPTIETLRDCKLTDLHFSQLEAQNCKDNDCFG